MHSDHAGRQPRERRELLPRPTKRSALPLAGFAVALPLLLPACAASVPSRSNLAGTWRDHDDRAALVLRSNGTCAADELVTVQRVITGTCSWTVGHASVALDFSRDASAGVDGVLLEINGSGDDAVLDQVFDRDADQRLEYHR